MNHSIFWDDLITVHTHGGIGRAAAHLNISQSALTRRLQRLEESLGVRLFEKAGRGVALTPAGRRLLQYAQAAQNQWLSMRDTLRDMGTQLTAPRRIVVSPSATHEINAWIKTSSITATGVWIQVLTPARCWQSIIEGSADEAWTLIPEGTLDDLSVRHTGVHHAVMAKDALMPYSITQPDRPGPLYALARGRGKAPPLVLYAPGTLMGEAVRQRLKNSRLDLANQVRAEVSTTELAARLIAQGIGVGWLPERYAAQPAFARTLIPAAKKDWGLPLVLVKSIVKNPL